jgi:hypothetical protein
MLAPDSLLSSDVAHLHQAYDVDVVGAIVATQVATPAMYAAGQGSGRPARRPPRGRPEPQPCVASGWLSRKWLPLGSRTAASRTP